MKFRIAVTACSAMITGVAAGLIATQRSAGAMPVSSDWGCDMGAPNPGCYPGSTCCYLGTWDGGRCDTNSMEVSDCCVEVAC